MMGDDEDDLMNLGGGCPVHGEDYMAECTVCGQEFCTRCHTGSGLCPECAELPEDELEAELGEETGEAETLTEDEEAERLLREADELPEEIIEGEDLPEQPEVEAESGEESEAPVTEPPKSLKRGAAKPRSSPKSSRQECPPAKTDRRRAGATGGRPKSGSTAKSAKRTTAGKQGRGVAKSHPAVRSARRRRR